MPALQTPAVCTVKVNNEELKYSIYAMELVQPINGHHTLEVKFRQDVVGDDKVEDPEPYTSFLGKPLSLNITPSGGVVDASRALEFIGIVTEVSFENSIDAVNVMIIKAKSPTVSVDGGRKNAFYKDQSASDIIGSILRNHPVTLGNLESTDGTMRFSVQYRETDYEYIMRLASSFGKFAFYDGKEFHLASPSSSGEEELKWRETLGSFTMNLGSQSFNYASKVYNYEQDKTFAQDTTSLPPETALSQFSKKSPDISKEIFKEASYSDAPLLVSDAQSLDAELNRTRSRAMGQMIRCRGYSIVPAVKVGGCVKVTGLGFFSQQFWVKSVTHVYDESGKYHNYFDCTPIDIAYPESRTSGDRKTHLQSALVVDNSDPEKLGRIKVKFPWNDDDTIWVRFLTPHAGKDRGWYCLPEIDDEVLVGFELDNPDQPIALGALYNKGNSPHSETQADDNAVKMFLTKSGNQIMLKDESGSEEIRISMKDGKNAIVMNLSGPTIDLQSEGDVKISGNNLNVEGQGDINLKAQSNVKIEAGSNMELKAGANMTVQASGNQEVKGAMVSVSGNPINLN